MAYIGDDDKSDVLDAAIGDIEDTTAAFSVDLDGYEGPLHVLLGLAREQKVDLRRISILKLAEQYLEFITVLRSTRIDLAADYLVMASWLAYLKSRLLLPKKERQAGEQPVEDIAAHLAWRLMRLDALRLAGENLYQRPQTQVDVFVRGAPESINVNQVSLWQADMLDLLRAYASQRVRATPVRHEVRTWPVYSLDDARKRLEASAPKAKDWKLLGDYAPRDRDFRAHVPTLASRYASLVAASLELAKQGNVLVRQLEPNAPLYVKGSAYE